MAVTIRSSLRILANSRRTTKRSPRRCAVESFEDRRLLAGNVFLTGHDTLDHGGQNHFDSRILDFMRGSGSENEIPASEYSIAVLGTGMESYSFSEGSPSKPGYERTTYFNTDAIASQQVSWDEVFSYDGLIVTSLGTGNLSASGSELLNTQAAAIAAAIQSGMDIWANSSSGDSNYYDFLRDLVEVESTPFSGSSGFQTTDLGDALGIVPSMINGHPTHSAFAPNPALSAVETNGGQNISVIVNTAPIDGVVWHDANQDGIRDAAEQGVWGVPVRLLDQLQMLVNSTTTGPDGSYQFTAARPGQYHVEMAAAGVNYSARGQGADDSLDSDIDPVTGRSDAFQTDFGQGQTIDAGVFGSGETASIGSIVWEDANYNGLRDPGEMGMAEVVVQLLDADLQTLDSTVTAADGTYQFNGLATGVYALALEEPDGFRVTLADQGFDDQSDSDASATTLRTQRFGLVAGQQDGSRDVGLVRVHTIGDRVWRDEDGNGIQDSHEPGLEGVTVRLLNVNNQVVDETVSDVDGYYRLRGVPGQYVVEFVAPSGFTFAEQHQGQSTSLDSDASPETGRTPALTVPSGKIDTSIDAGLAEPDLIISEFMSINQTTLMDKFGGFSDWIEIANVGVVPADLEGWFLTDRANNLTKWQFPELRLEPGQYLVVFASGNSTITDGEPHTNFRLGSSGEYLGLVKPDGLTVVSEFAPTYGQQSPDVSYGRGPAGELLYYVRPTPGAPNEGGQTQIQFNLVITEFMAENHVTLADEDGDYPDWLELYNAGQTAVNLEGWYLTDEEGFLTKWSFPRITLSPQQYLVVFASENDRDDRDSELHTNFKLGVDGDYLALVDPDGETVISEYEFDAQIPDVSYGLSPDLRVQRQFTQPTPGQQNQEQRLTVHFSHERGFYQQPFELTLATETAGGQVYYTTDGSEPSGSHGTLFSGPITIDATTNLRAIAVLGDEQGTVNTHSYIFLEDVISQTGAGRPDTWGFFPDYEMDPEIVDDPRYRADLLQGLLALPTVSISTSEAGLYSIPNGIYANPMFAGDGWVRNASVEVIDPLLGSSIQLNAGLSVEQSLGSVAPPDSPKLPLRVTLAEQYGTTVAAVPLFGDSGVSTVDGFLLHSEYEDSWLHPDGAVRNEAQYVRDQFIRETQAAMGQPALASGFAHLYLNGVYWGVYNAIEPPTAHVAAQLSGGSEQEYDVLNGAQVVAGDPRAWDAMFALAAVDLAGPAAYEDVLAYLDVENLIDFIILDSYAGNQADAMSGWYAARRRQAGEGFQFFAWDHEQVLSAGQSTIGPETMPMGTPWFLFQQLTANGEFRNLFADRLQMHLFNGGALATELVSQRLQSYELAAPLVAEAARWGDYRRDGHEAHTGPYELLTPDVQWSSERTRLLTEQLPEQSQAVLERFQAQGLYPAIFAPEFSQQGGVVTPESELAMTAASGAVYYTLDGSDPRLPDGSLSTTAVRYDAPLTFEESTHLEARALQGGQWSAVNAATFLVDRPTTLQITEIMYHPASPNAEEAAAGFTQDDEFEFLELKNVGASVITLDGLRIVDGVDFDFAAGGVSTLAPGEHVVVVSNRDAFTARYGPGVNIAGEYDGHLNNGGEQIIVVGSFGETVASSYFADVEPLTDGVGFSLVGSLPSAFRGGSPGEDDPRLEVGAVVINELMSFPIDSPQGDWIELHNTTDHAINVGGWYLSDNADQLAQYQIPADTTIFAGDYVVFYQSDFGFGLRREGEQVFLSSGRDGELGGIRTSVDFETAEAGTSYGRFVAITGEEEFLRLSAATPGAENAMPLVGPLVVNEIMYNPPAGEDEYIELLNITGEDVLLDGWRLTAIDFHFPPGTTVPAHGYALVVSDDPDHFRAHHPLRPEVPVFGPFSNSVSLDNGGESVTLYKPDEAGEVRADRVVYEDDAPWSALADGRGASLVRRDPAAYGNDVANWTASVLAGSPGEPNENIRQTARSSPYLQDFESTTLSALSGWDFAIDGLGNWEIATDGDPWEGISHLRASHQAGESSRQEAILILDLLDQQGRSDVALDFYLERRGADATGQPGAGDLQVSGDGVHWTMVGALAPPARQYAHYAFDLDVALSNAGISLDRDVFVKFGHASRDASQVMSLDNVRVSNLDFFPPSVIQQSPAANTAGPWTSFDVTFDDPIDAATFTVEDVQIISPAGSVIVPRQVTSSDGFTWTVALDPQALAGVYRLTIGPEIADTSGNLMSQGGTFVDGQSLDRQPYVSAIEVGELAPQPYPWSEGFESGSLASLVGWSFATTASGTWRVTSSDNPQVGGFHLRAGQVAAGPSTQEAILKLDLASQAGAADLSLDFWMTRLGHSTGNFSVLSISGDNQTWSRVYSMAPRPGEPIHYVFDLDAVLSTSGVLFDADVYLKFEHTGAFSNDTMFLDELRVGNSDFFGPSIVWQSLSGQTPDPVAGFRVSFDQDIDSNSFSTADVSVIDPLGNSVLLAGDPVEGGDGLTYTISFAQPQVIPGTYRFAIGPEVADEAGNAMNQDGDPNNGETNGNDTYFGQFRLGPPAPAAFPAQEDFEAGDVLTLSGWSFSVTGTGSWDVTDNGSPHAGVYHLRAEQGEDGTSSQQAVFAVDLSGHAADPEIYLDFWARQTGDGPHNESRLFVSGNDQDWTYVATVTPNRGQSTYFAFDLADVLSEASIPADGDVYVMFFHQGSTRGDGLAVDQVRVSAIDPFGPMIVSQTILINEAGTSRFQVTFDEPVMAETFTVDDVAVTLPGTTAPISSVTTTDNRTFTITLPTPALAGLYDLSIGPDIHDANGIPMNQDGDSVNGESNGDDLYVATLFVAATPQTIPYLQGFESGDIGSLAGWTFQAAGEYSWGGGDWKLVTDNQPHEGAYHLRATQLADCWTQHDAVLALDLSAQAGASNLVLEFYMQRLSGRNKSSGGRNMGKLLLSGDGATWTQLGSPDTLIDTASSLLTDLDNDGALDLVPPLGEYQLYRFDLDEMLTRAGINEQDVVYLDVHRLGFYADDITTWDNIRVYRDGPDLEPPVVSSISINAGAGDPPDLPQGVQPTTWQMQRSEIRAIEVVFSEPIQVKPSDLQLINHGMDAANDPDTSIPLSDDHLLINGRILRLVFDAQELPSGVYSLSLQPTVADSAGNALDGDGDGVAGDAFSWMGDADNRFYVLRGDWNGDQGVSIFDFASFAYWFGRPTSPVEVAPAYMDLNGDGGVTIFDFPDFANRFGDAVIMEAGIQRFSPGEEALAAGNVADAVGLDGLASLDRADRLGSGEREIGKRVRDAALLQVLANWTPGRRDWEREFDSLARPSGPDAEAQDQALLTLVDHLHVL